MLRSECLFGSLCSTNASIRTTKSFRGVLSTEAPPACVRTQISCMNHVNPVKKIAKISSGCSALSTHQGEPINANLNYLKIFTFSLI